MGTDFQALYRTPLPSFRTGLFYGTYAYPTKIAPESIAVYIATHTQPGDTILDAFAGSGATGLAALMCEHPTPEMVKLADALGVSPIWGARNASLYDISTYGTFAASVMTNPPDADEFRAAAEVLISTVTESCGWMYQAKSPHGQAGEIRHIIWSSQFFCPSCGREFSFYDGMVKWNPLRIQGAGTCPHCGRRVSGKDCAAETEEVWDSLLQTNVLRRKRIPILVYGESEGSSWKRPVTEEDVDRINAIESMEYPSYERPKPIRWGELHRSGYHQGISHLHHFYSKRNFLVVSALWHAAEDFPPSMRDALRLLILSYNETHSTLMTRVVAKKASKDFVLSGAQSGVLYVSNLPVEKNVLKGLERKVRPFTRAFSYINSCHGHVTVNNQSCTEMIEEDHSIDYVFTDPPFGDFIPYSEVNQINELWLDRVTDCHDEAIISPSQGKNINTYEHLLEESLSEMFRVLKEDSYATLVFHSSKAEVWGALSNAIERSGLKVTMTSRLNRAQDSFKQIVSASSVKNDSLILLSKQDATAQPPRNTPTNMRTFSPSSADPRVAYSEYINFCLENGLAIKLDAREAYARLATRQ